MVQAPTSESAARPAGARKLLGELLVERGILTNEVLEDALAEQQRAPERLGQILVRRAAIHAMDLARALADQHGQRLVDFEEEAVDPAAAQKLPQPFARRLQALPMGWDGERLVVAMVDPTDVIALDDVRSLTGCELVPVRAEPTQLRAAIDIAWRAPAHDIVSAVSLSADESKPPVPTQLLEDDSPIVRFVSQVIQRAVEQRVSDIHLEPTGEAVRIRYRIDGVLHDAMAAPASLHASMVSRIKIMAEMDISERRLPQDGRLSIEVAGHAVDARVVSLPTSHGEALVIRLLDKAGVLRMDQLGFRMQALERYRRSVGKSWGAILVTGPTGSGKTSTLYATLAELNGTERNIITVEDPIEYQLAGIKQVQLNRRAGLTFASALRAILRADPDVLLVGEIRDLETARIATEAALTGHLVLSTLHTNDAASSPLRLIEMGVEPFLVASALDCIVAQRLARRLCDKCKEPHPDAASELAAVGWDLRPLASSPTAFHRPVGCGSCSRTGYRGRFAIQEVMVISEEISRLISAGSPSDEIQALTIEQGMAPLRHDGLFKAAHGDTSIEELVRVVA